MRHLVREYRCGARFHQRVQIYVVIGGIGDIHILPHQIPRAVGGMNGFRRHAVVVVMVHLCGFIVLRIDHCALMGFIGAGGAVSFRCAVLLGSGLRRRAVALQHGAVLHGQRGQHAQGRAFLRTVAVPGSQFRAQHRRTDAADRNLPPAAGSAGSQHKRKQRHGQRRRPPWGGLSLFLSLHRCKHFLYPDRDAPSYAQIHRSIPPCNFQGNVIVSHYSHPPLTGLRCTSAAPLWRCS